MRMTSADDRPAVSTKVLCLKRAQTDGGTARGPGGAIAPTNGAKLLAITEIRAAYPDHEALSRGFAGDVFDRRRRDAFEPGEVCRREISGQERSTSVSRRLGLRRRESSISSPCPNSADFITATSGARLHESAQMEFSRGTANSGDVMRRLSKPKMTSRTARPTFSGPRMHRGR